MWRRIPLGSYVKSFHHVCPVSVLLLSFKQDFEPTPVSHAQFSAVVRSLHLSSQIGPTNQHQPLATFVFFSVLYFSTSVLQSTDVLSEV